MQIYQHFQHQKRSCQNCTCKNCRNRIAESWGYNSAIIFWVAETAEAAADSISTFCWNFCWYLVISAFYIAQPLPPALHGVPCNLPPDAAALEAICRFLFLLFLLKIVYGTILKTDKIIHTFLGSNNKCQKKSTKGKEYTALLESIMERRTEQLQ